eukprot:517305-Rhodomonas_salina.1
MHQVRERGARGWPRNRLRPVAQTRFAKGRSDFHVPHPRKVENSLGAIKCNRNTACANCTDKSVLGI